MRNELAGSVGAIMPTVEQLAQAVIGMLDAQQQFFKTKSRYDLIQAKNIEAAIRKTCMGVIQKGNACDKPTQ